MKLQPDRPDAQSILGCGPGWLSLAGEPGRITHSLIVGAGLRRDWSCTRFEQLTPAHFAQLADCDAEVVLFGSGHRLRFVPPAWLAPLMARRIGLETMDTLAACRTYNLLLGDGRKVVAALLLEPPADTAVSG